MNEQFWSPLVAEQVDQTCDRFESAWQAATGQERPRIEDYIGNPAAPEQQELLAELILLDVYYRRRHGETPEPAHYTARFPNLDPFWLAAVLTASRQADPPTIAGQVYERDRELTGTPTGPRAPPERLGRYRITTRIGAGSFGTVYRGYDEALDRDVAIKVPHPRPTLSPRDEEASRTEARVLASLDHPHIVPIFDVGSTSSCPYFIVSKFIEGKTLAQQLKEEWPTRERCVELVRLIALALDYAHRRRVIHRDIKPSNILLDPEGKPYLADFGLALHEADSSKAVAVAGTPAYMAPEQADGKGHPVDSRSDLYSLGVVLHELLTGYLPHQVSPSHGAPPAPPRDCRPPLPPSRILSRDLDTIVWKCLALDPNERYPTAAQLADDLQRWRERRPVQARPVGWMSQAWRWARRNPALAAASSLALVALLAAVVVSVCLAAYRANIVRANLRAWAYAALDTALARCAEGQVNEGMLWFAQSLRIAGDEFPEIERVIRLNLAGWYTQLRPLRAMLQAENPIEAVAFRQDDQTIITATKRNMQFWMTATGCQSDNPVVLPGEHQATALSSDGRIVLARGPDRTLQRLETSTGNLLGQRVTVDAALRAFALSPDGTHALAGDWVVNKELKGEVRLWDLVKGESLGPALPHEGIVDVVAFSEDGQWIVTACHVGNRSTVFIRDAATGAVHHKLPDQPLVQAVAASPDRRQLLVACANHSNFAQLWEVASGKPIGHALPHLGRISNVAFSHDSRWIVTAGIDHTARLWEAPAGMGPRASLCHGGLFFTLAFSPNGKFLAVGSSEPFVQIWDVAAGQPHGAPLRHAGGVRAVAFDARSRILLTGSVDGTAQVWEVGTGTALGRPLRQRDALWSVAISPDGKTALTGGSDASAQLWNLETSTPLGDPFQHEYTVYTVAFNRNGKTLLTASADGRVRLWDARTQRPTGAVLDHKKAVFAVAFSPDRDSRWILTGGANHRGQVWNRQGLPHGPPLQHGENIYAVAFSPNGNLCATASRDRSARLWETVTGTAIGEPLLHRAPVRSVAFSPDGRLLVTGAEDHTAQIWDVATRRRAGPPLTHALGRAVFSPNGKLIATGSDDKTVALWDVPEPVVGTVEAIELWTKVITGMELDSPGTAHVLDYTTWEGYRRRLQELGGGPRP